LVRGIVMVVETEVVFIGFSIFDVDVVSVELIFEVAGLLILKFLILSLFRGRWGTSSSVLGLLVVDCPFWYIPRNELLILILPRRSRLSLPWPIFDPLLPKLEESDAGLFTPTLTLSQSISLCFGPTRTIAPRVLSPLISLIFLLG